MRFIHWARAFDVGNVFAENEWALLFHARSNEGLGQQPFQAPSVFNFYRPGFIAPQSYSGNEGLTAPELQIIHEGSVIGYSDWMLEYVFNSSPTEIHRLIALYLIIVMKLLSRIHLTN